MKTTITIIIALLPVLVLISMAKESEKAFETCLKRHSVAVCNHELNN